MAPADMLDTARSVETPEGVELALNVAGPLPRFLAWILDVTIRLIFYLGLQIALGGLGDFGMGLYLLIVFFVEWFYPVLFEVYWGGATPGKRGLGLCVVNDDGTPVRPTASIVRNLVRFVDFLPVLYGFGLLSCMFHPQFKRLGDLSAGTVVIYLDAAQQSVKPAVDSALEPPLPLTPQEQKTVVDFAERRAQFTAERADELALAAGPLAQGAGAPADRLVAYAAWIAGDR